METLELDHVGIAVESLDEALELYTRHPRHGVGGDRGSSRSRR